MEEDILNILERLISHDISKYEAAKKIMLTLKLSDMRPSTQKALNASVSAVYFSDSSDYENYHYEVIQHLCNISRPSREDIITLYGRLNSD